ncbi:MAG: S8 family peptidase, partial [Gammaproteobacteria bacterium]|nr:S8 family peptidase [Gammaproteobacteria bacterium]
LIDDVQITFTTYRPDTDYTTLVDAYLAHNQGLTGDGIAVAVVDTGLGFEGNVFYDADNYQSWIGSNYLYVPTLYDAIADVQTTGDYSIRQSTDASGHGTHMSSIIGSSQRNNENGRKNGVAPLADIIPVKAFGSNGAGAYADVIRGIDWIVANKDTYNIRVLNASFFSEAKSYYWEDPLNQAVMAAWDAGIVVVASAGNIDPASNAPFSIGVPGNVPYVITVGAMTDAYTPDNPDDDYVMSFSALGPTYERFVKPDLVAPGGHMRSYMPADGQIVADHPEFFDTGDYFTMSGTSQSAAVVSGIVALMLEADPTLSPDDVKCRLAASAQPARDGNGDLISPIFQQGSGLVNAYDAVNSNASGCANQGLDISKDIAGTEHYIGEAVHV